MVTIKALKYVLINSVVFLFFAFHVPRPKELGDFNPRQIFKPSKILKRSIINAFPCVVVFALKLVLRHLKVLNF